MNHVTTTDMPAHPQIPAGDDFLDSSALAMLTPAELTRRVRELAPLIAGHAAETERLRRPVDAVWQALRRSGFFYQFVPKQFGGMATDVDSFIDAALPIAEACASTAWVACFCAAHNLTVANFPVQARADLFGGAFPYVVAPQMTMPPARAVKVEGGLRVTGAWQWGTGIMHADWVLAVAMLVEGENPPEMKMVLCPASEVQVFDTWQADGLAGTGSNDVRMDDVFVPEHYVLSDLGVLAGRGAAARDYEEPIWSTPLIVFNGMAAAVPALGAARSGLKMFRNRLAGRVQKGSDTPQAQKPAAQLRLAKADLMVRNAELLLRDAGRRAGGLGWRDEPELTAERLALRAQVAYSVSLCRDAVLHLAEGAGSSVHMLNQPFQRVVRDVGIIASHVGFDLDLSYELHGRGLVGLPPNSMMF